MGAIWNFVTLFSLIRDVAELASEVTGEWDHVDDEDDDKPELDPWQAMMFAQAGVDRPFPQIPGKDIK